MRYMGRAARMQRHHKRHKGEAGINLVSMIDMLTVLVFFLLVYSTEVVEVLPSQKEVQLPESTSGGEVPRSRGRDHHGARHPAQRQVGRQDRRGPRERRRDHTRRCSPRSKLEANGMLRQAGLSEEEKIANREVTIMADKELPV